MKPSATIYEIRIKGYLDNCWEDWLGGMTLVHTTGGETILSGSLPDQAALYGILAKIRDLGVLLISVNQIDRDL